MDTKHWPVPWKNDIKVAIFTLLILLIKSYGETVFEESNIPQRRGCGSKRGAARVNHKSQKGSATLLFALSLPVFICALVMAWDIGMLYTAKITARHSVILAARAAAAELDLELEELSNPGDLEPLIKEDEALTTFKQSLDKNLKHHKGRLFAINDGDDIEQYISGFWLRTAQANFK